MAQNDTKYLLIDWDERETSLHTKQELTDYLESLMSLSGIDVTEAPNTDDLEVELWKITKSQTPKSVCLQLNVTLDWKELT